jgi:hypothetical protein
MLSDGVKEGAFDVADPKISARAISTPPAASIIRPMPTNGTSRMPRRGSTPC